MEQQLITSGHRVSPRSQRIRTAFAFSFGRHARSVPSAGVDSKLTGEERGDRQGRVGWAPPSFRPPTYASVPHGPPESLNQPL